MFQRLPRDNFPDDTQTTAFQTFTDGRKRPKLRLPVHWRRRVGIGAGILAALVALIILLPMLGLVDRGANTGDLETTIPAPTEISLFMFGDFPPTVAQRYINVPARIDDGLPAGQSRGYTFLLEAGTTWEIQVFAGPDFLPRINLYGPNGDILARTEAAAVGQTAGLTYTVGDSGLYAILLEGAQTTGGGYTFTMMPQSLP